MSSRAYFCGAALLAALFAMKDLKPPWTWGEILICLGLGVLAAASALFSSTAFSSGLRVFILLTSGMGGFWCARILLHDKAGQERFLWLCFALLISASILGVIGFFTWIPPSYPTGRPSYIFGTHGTR